MKRALLALSLLAQAAAADPGKLSVYAVNYPLAYFAERVAGTHADVVLPVPPGIDPAFWTPDVAIIGRIQEADVRANKALGAHGAALIPDGGAVLTHCNAGALATAGYGTAVGVIRAAWDGGARFSVFCTETRPWLQGARLTMWELQRLGIPTSLIVDSAAASLMSRGEVQAVLVGADRIAANGDVANKIGTYSLAVLAKSHRIPFYVAAPLSTVDMDTETGDAIPIEERAATEVTHIAGRAIAPEGVSVRNPVFDVTPFGYVTAIVTEQGLARAPYEPAFRRLAKRAGR